METTTKPKVLKMLRYTADLRPRSDDFPRLDFWIEQMESGDQPWRISSELGSDTHHSLDELLFWNLIVDGEGRHISEAMRARINADFGKAS